MKIVILTTDNREQHRDYKNPVPHFGTAPAALLQGVAMLPDVEVHVVSCVRQEMSSPEKLAPNIYYHALLVPKIGWMSTGYQGCIRAVRRKLKEIQPDIVHGQGTERDCAVTAVFSGYPNVLTIHGNMRLIAQLTRPKPFSFNWLNAYLEAFTIPRSLGVVCITRYTQDAVRDLARKTWVLPNAVDAAYFDIKPEPAAPPTILCVGLVCPRKNQNALIRALDELAKTREFRLLFLGNVSAETPYGAEFLDLLKSRPWCEYAGFADHIKLQGYFAQATMLMLPSLEDNCPMVVLEAMAANVPVIAANVGGVPDLVQDKVNGRFCDPLDPVSMRDAVAGLLDEQASGKQIAKTAKESALQRFHPKIIARRHVEIYAEAFKTVV